MIKLGARKAHLRFEERGNLERSLSYWIGYLKIPIGLGQGGEEHFQ